MDINEAVNHYANCSELPELGESIDYADGIDSDERFHDLQRRLRERGLMLTDVGGNYEVQRYRGARGP